MNSHILDLDHRLFINIAGEKSDVITSITNGPFSGKIRMIPAGELGSHLYNVDNVICPKEGEFNLCLGANVSLTAYSNRPFHIYYFLIASNPAQYFENTVVPFIKANRACSEEFTILLDESALETIHPVAKARVISQIQLFSTENSISFHLLDFNKPEEPAFLQIFTQSISESLARIRKRRNDFSLNCIALEAKTAADLKTYTKPYSGLLFGTHHKKRDQAINEAFQQIADSKNEHSLSKQYELKLMLVRNQMQLITTPNFIVLEEEIKALKPYFKDEKWLTKIPEHLPDDFTKSGFYQKLKNLEKDLENLSASWKALTSSTDCSQFTPSIVSLAGN